MVATPHADLLKGIFPDGEGGAEAHTFIASSTREMLNKAENEASGVVSTALTNLALYRDPVVALNTASCDFRIHDLTKDRESELERGAQTVAAAMPAREMEGMQAMTPDQQFAAALEKTGLSL